MEMIKKFAKSKWILNLIMGLEKEDRNNLLSNYKKRKQYYTSEYPEFEANLKEMAKCALCPDMCGFDAPCLLLSKNTTNSPQNKSRLGLFMGMNRIPFETPSAIDTIYSCMNCDACKHWCPMDISAGDLMIQMRSELEKRDLIPESVHNLKNRIELNGTIFEENPFKSMTEFAVDHPTPDIFYYIGCMSAKNRLSMVKANIAILKHLGVRFTSKVENRKCCGSPLQKVGFTSVAKKVALENHDLIKNSKCHTVVTDCPACLQTLSETYEEWGIKIKPKIVHIIDYINENIMNGKLILNSEVNKVVTYHDPCIMARKLKDSTTPRTILSKIPSLQLKESFLHGEETRCCGYGGGYHITNPEFSDNEGIIRLSQLRKHNPDLIVSACPTCEYALEIASMKNLNKQITSDKVVDISEIVAEAMGLTY